jgi:hypothetical protein
MQMQVLQLGFKIPIGKSKYGSRYYNETPKFQLVKVCTGACIATKPQNSNW